jgi:hypothetical protein
MNYFLCILGGFVGGAVFMFYFRASVAKERDRLKAELAKLKEKF